MRGAWNQPRYLNRCTNCFVVAVVLLFLKERVRETEEKMKEEGRDAGREEKDRGTKLKGKKQWRERESDDMINIQYKRVWK